MVPHITAPGVYDVPIDAYHNTEVCPAPSISGSGVVKLAPPDGEACVAPIKYWIGSTLNPAREPADTIPLREGKLVHTLFLEGRAAALAAFAIDDLPTRGEGSRTAREQFRVEMAAAGKVVVTQRQWGMALAMVAALEREPLMRAAFSDGAQERTLVWQDESTGMWCRCRPDWLPHDPTHMPEYKTAASAMRSFFERQIDDYGYHIKAAHMIAGIRALELGDPRTFTHWVQERDAPYLVQHHVLPRETLEWAEIQRRAALDLFARCVETNTWPGYPPVAQETGLPAYKLARLARLDLAPPSQETTHEPIDRSRYLLAG
jgi:hypothetical protein